MILCFYNHLQPGTKVWTATCTWAAAWAWAAACTWAAAWAWAAAAGMHSVGQVMAREVLNNVNNINSAHYNVSSTVLLPLERYLIRQVMANIASHSCINFRERTSEPDYIKIIFDRQKCYSHIGRVGGKQLVSLGIFCVNWWNLGTVYHELFHTLGFYHEHTRPDRDYYIEVMWNNIADGQAQNFLKRSFNSVALTDMPYDIKSVMHYSPFAFGKWSFLTPTIRSRRIGYSFLRAGVPSKIDYQKLNRLYRCQRKGKYVFSRLDHAASSSSWFHHNALDQSDIRSYTHTSHHPSHATPALPHKSPVRGLL
nr:hatching enzyme 1.2-like isoform X3 [Cherax quadricarinatus]